ncbi:uncharacterized protein si:ch211-183d21.1 isoform X1 [Conger conger]|uniref:uncharacterized protein si:ch211-183d21.1 isoform X1 n=1 Tax=Conger conger TaxID=82655 RepID=UPI002A59D9B3|nr:uncharacterized protein si:ch211-183d21.1 isoform X1 [Conger conger]XP_061087195.1 uncharacterized protein si:ch211-183d21.1 isoform X1 [Conger conger]
MLLRLINLTVRLAAFFILVVVTSVMSEACLMISEVNADNPRLDTTEFVELYHTSGQRTSLDGYTLVFYNGNGNIAYKVLDLKGYTTDDRGYFLVGSIDVQPKPAILLPPNTIQNGPDAIVLYHSSEDNGKYNEKMDVTAAGLVDAIVYTTRRSGDAEFLARTLTPGSPAFVEDESIHEGDESIERCWLSVATWTFQVAPPSPGQRNRCSPPRGPDPRISELRLGGEPSEVFVELTVPQSTDPLVLVLLDGRTDTVSFSMEIKPAKDGLVLISSGKSGGDVVLTPGDHSVLAPRATSSGAVVLYSRNTDDFPVGSPLSPQQPLDAFVYSSPDAVASDNLTEALIPGRGAFRLHPRLEEGGLTLSRCGTADWNRDPGVFIEVQQTPGRPNQCSWPATCPHNVFIPEATATPLYPPDWDPYIQNDFVLSEVNADTPGAGEDMEFIEIWHPSGRRMSLEGVWLLLFNGHNSKPYWKTSLTGHFTNAQGYFLLGSDKVTPTPSISLPPNTVQNGPDAVALYRSPYGSPLATEATIPTRGLLDAIVYRQLGSDKEAPDLSNAFIPGQIPLLEDPTFLQGDETLSRCNSLQPANMSAFVVTSPTPLRKNVCPQPPTLAPPPEGVVINEVGSAQWTNGSRQESFVELFAAPLTGLQSLVLVVFEQGYSRATMALPLTGKTDQDGYYVIGNITGADQALPLGFSGTGVPARGAVALCHGTAGSCAAERAPSSRAFIDTVVFSEDSRLLSTLAASRGQQVTPGLRSVMGPASLSRCACCDQRSPQAWTTSSQTPRHPNLCPSATFSSNVDLCLGPPTSDTEQRLPNCSGWRQGAGSRQEMEVALYLEDQCHCGISALNLVGANFSCVAGWLRVYGIIRALSNHQRDLIEQTSHTQSTRMLAGSCSSSMSGKSVGTKSGLVWQIGLAVVVLLLLVLGLALLTYFYRRRRPQNYFSMELSEHTEGPGEI